MKILPLIHFTDALLALLIFMPFSHAAPENRAFDLDRFELRGVDRRADITRSAKVLWTRPQNGVGSRRDRIARRPCH
jgi:hypothetical protein